MLAYRFLLSITTIASVLSLSLNNREIRQVCRCDCAN
jgi:hypothetical protein